jgi:hypothetical protein
MATKADDDSTRIADLQSWEVFCLAYYEPIRRALRLLRLTAEEVDEFANSFLLKAAEKGFLTTYHEYRMREEAVGRQARFRPYLYRALHNYVTDWHRSRTSRRREEALDPVAAEALAAPPKPFLDPDALYSLDILHRALQELRIHCERTGMPHIWTIFEELLLADEFRGRKGLSREELEAAFPGRHRRFIDNALTTARRAFRRFVQELVPRGLRDGVSSTERFEEWMEILRRSNASQFNLLHVAYRVSPHFTPEMSQAASRSMVVDDRSADAIYEEPSLVPADDELGLLLSFRLSLPLTETLDAEDLHLYVPPRNPLWDAQKPVSRRTSTGAAIDRPFCLATLVDPSPDEARALADADLIGLLRRLKALAKQLRRRPDHAMPEVFAKLLYTLVNVLAETRCGSRLHSIEDDSLVGNVRWFLEQSWLDDRVSRLFRSGLSTSDEG